MEINIGMTRSAIRKVAQDLVEKVDRGDHISVSLYGKNNEDPNQEIIVTFSDEDMERFNDGDILVEIDSD